MCNFHEIFNVLKMAILTTSEQFILIGGNYKCKVVDNRKLSYHQSEILILGFMLSTSCSTEKYDESSISHRNEWIVLFYLLIAWLSLASRYRKIETCSTCTFCLSLKF